MQKSEIHQAIREFVVSHFLDGRDDRLQDDGLLLGDLVDSAGLVDLISYVQDRFGITVEDHEVVLENLASVNDLVAFIDRKVHTSSEAQA